MILHIHTAVVQRVVVPDSCVHVALHIVNGLVLRVGVGNINFVTITIVSLPVPASSVGSVDVVDVALLQIFAASAGAVFAQSMAMLPAHVGKADQGKSHRYCGKAQEDVEISRIGTWKIT